PLRSISHSSRSVNPSGNTSRGTLQVCSMRLVLLRDRFQDNLLQQLLKPFHRHFDFWPDFVVSGSLSLLDDFQLIGDRLYPMGHAILRRIRGVQLQRDAASRLDLPVLDLNFAEVVLGRQIS